jgi:hydroxyacylglutathione hydrolase
VVIAGHSFDVLHCPGHTPGHIVFLDRQMGFGIFGDVLFRGSVGRTDFPYASTQDLLTSIRDKLMVLDDRTVFICGHGARSTIGEERRSNPFVGQAA